MANSRYDYHKEEELHTDLRFNKGTYIIVRIDGHKFHTFTDKHKFHKPNDKRALDLMIDSAKKVLRTYKGHIRLAYGHSDEFSFLINSTSTLLSRRIYKITSMLPVVFATNYNSRWNDFFGNPARGEVIERKYDAWFDARPKEYPNYQSVIDYFRWRQVDCHINNLYNTTLSALNGRYIKHEMQPTTSGDPIEFESSKKLYLSGGGSEDVNYRIEKIPITAWIQDKAEFLSSRDATDKLSRTDSSEKHDIMFLEYKINYNNELEQFKKGTIIVDTLCDFAGENADSESIKHFHRDITRSDDFWQYYKYIFEDFVDCPPTG